MTVIQLVTDLLSTGKYHSEVLIELDNGKTLKICGITTEDEENTFYLEVEE